MANDRVIIRCDGCGAWKTLMAYNGASISSRGPEVLDWITEHGWCHPAKTPGGLNGNPGFSLHTEDAIGVELDITKQNSGPP